MNKRLQTILEIEHITASQLADILGIQRGGVSHLLSGRNKPSFDFLERILRKFPELNAEWLITGQGKPIRSENGSTTAIPSTDKLTESIKSTDIKSNIFENDLFGSQADDSPHTTPKETLSPGIPTSNGKQPIRIIVYFSDGTYSDFYPFSVPSPSDRER